MKNGGLYASPRDIRSLDDCFFYHTMDIPGYGLVKGHWDLRDGAAQYLAGLDFRGKRVLEMGTASGFLCFHMESCGAEVVAYDVNRDGEWDWVPFAGVDLGKIMAEDRERIDRINNAWWLAHRALRSTARMVYGTVYEVPEAIGPVDVVTYGSILLHVRDPFLALQMGARLAREQVVVTELLSRLSILPSLPAPGTFLRKLLRPRMMFLPDSLTGSPYVSWWRFTPALIRRFLGVLGFEESRVTYHSQLFEGRRVRLFTVVGRRTCGRATGA